MPYSLRVGTPDAWLREPACSSCCCCCCCCCVFSTCPSSTSSGCVVSPLPEPDRLAAEAASSRPGVEGPAYAGTSADFLQGVAFGLPREQQAGSSAWRWNGALDPGVHSCIGGICIRGPTCLCTCCMVQLAFHSSVCALACPAASVCLSASCRVVECGISTLHLIVSPWGTVAPASTQTTAVRGPSWSRLEVFPTSLLRFTALIGRTYHMIRYQVYTAAARSVGARG